MRKNIANQVIGCDMTALDGSEFTGQATVYVEGDSGGQVIGSVGSGLATHKGHGFHIYQPATAETNYDYIAFTFVGTGAVTKTIQVYTGPGGGTPFSGSIAETDLLNDALGQIGATRITSIDDGTVNANWCKTFYPQLRRSLLRTHHWNFAEKRIALTPTGTAPSFEFAYAYNLPADTLKMKEYNGDQTTYVIDGSQWWALAGRYKIEGFQILSNDATAKIVYVADILDPAAWDGLFYQMVSTWLASKLALAIAKDHNMSDRLMTRAVSLLLPLASAVDGQEGTVTPQIVDDLLWGR